MAADTVSLGVPGLSDVEEIGRGGFATVYRAREPEFDRLVAVKVLGATFDEDTKRRFARECQAIGGLSWHPNIVTVFRAGTTDSGRPFLVMEYAPRGSYGDRLRQRGRLDADEASRVLCLVAAALQTAHAASRVHRDVKPDNVLLSQAGAPLLSDFGIAAFIDAPPTQSTSASLGYAAPEVLQGETSGVAADVYGLGATLFAMVTGRAPFALDGMPWTAAIGRIVSEPLPDLRVEGVPDPICAVVEAAMTKSPTDRTASAGEFAERLNAARRSLGWSAVELVSPLPESSRNGASRETFDVDETGTRQVPPAEAGTRRVPPADAVESSSSHADEDVDIRRQHVEPPGPNWMKTLMRRVTLHPRLWLGGAAAAVLAVALLLVAVFTIGGHNSKPKPPARSSALLNALYSGLGSDVSLDSCTTNRAGGREQVSCSVIGLSNVLQLQVDQYPASAFSAAFAAAVPASVHSVDGNCPSVEDRSGYRINDVNVGDLACFTAGDGTPTVVWTRDSSRTFAELTGAKGTGLSTVWQAWLELPLPAAAP